MSIIEKMVSENIFKSFIFLIGVVFIFFTIICHYLYTFQVKWRAHALNARLPPACGKYWSARFHLLKDIGKVDPGQLFANLKPK